MTSTTPLYDYDGCDWYSNTSQTDDYDYEISQSKWDTMPESEKQNYDNGLTFVSRKAFNDKGEPIYKLLGEDEDGNPIYSHKQRIDRIAIFTSSYNGYIRNAATGYFTNHKVGSANEDLYYKVLLSTGECNAKNGSHTLFFDSPDEYAKHLHTYVSQIETEIWKQKYFRQMNQLLAKEQQKQKGYTIVK